MTNIYDKYRSVQTKRTECYDKRSAAFINTGRLSQDIYHIRLDEDIKAALVFNYKEGPDDAFVYTYKKDDLLKSDYFTYDNVNYLVYEDVKQTDEDITYKKQKAVECNVTFTFNGVSYNGYFTSSVRTHTDTEFLGSTAIMPDELPILILPSSVLEIGDRLTIGGKPWKVEEYDSITNQGITYLYLKRDYVAEDSEEVVETAPNYVAEEEVFVQDAAQDTTLTLNPMTEYTFTTKDGYFVTSPRIEIISRTATEVVFRIPYGIAEVSISIKESDDNILTKNYEVVL